MKCVDIPFPSSAQDSPAPNASQVTAKMRALLEAVNLKRECGDTSYRAGCESCRHWLQLATPARRKIKQLGFLEDSLTVACDMAEALEEADRMLGGHYGTGVDAGLGWHKDVPVRRAILETLAAWAKLAKEVPGA